MARFNDEEAFGLLAGPEAELNAQAEKQDSELELRHGEESGSASIRSLREYLAYLSSFPYRRSVLPILSRAAFGTLPSYVQNRIRTPPNRTAKSSTARRRTAFLDGLRGWASVVVVICHFSYTCHDLFHGYGYKPAYRNILRLPFFRLLYDGDPMVAIFFVVSGYSLSCKPLKVRHNAAELGRAMCSAAFRRSFRLFLPCAISTLTVALLVRLGVFELTRAIAIDSVLLNGAREPHPLRYASLSAQLYDWSWKFFKFIQPWAWTAAWQKIEYDTHLWTIPVEMRASIVLFATQLGVLQLRPRLRIVSMLVLMFMTIQKNNWVLFEFFAGFLLADLDMQRYNSATISEHGEVALPGGERPAQREKGKRLRRRMWLNCWWMSVFIMGAYFCSQPTYHSSVTPGWKHLSSLIPSGFSEDYRFWEMFGAPMLVWSISHVDFLRRLFDNSLSEYLGKISFALYLVHGTVIHTFGYLFLDFFWSMLDTSNTAAKELGFIMAGICMLPIVFWTADVFWRAVDEPVVKFTHYLECVCFERPAP